MPPPDNDALSQEPCGEEVAGACLQVDSATFNDLLHKLHHFIIFFLGRPEPEERCRCQICALSGSSGGLVSSRLDE